MRSEISHHSGKQVNSIADEVDMMGHQVNLAAGERSDRIFCRHEAGVRMNSIDSNDCSIQIVRCKSDSATALAAIESELKHRQITIFAKFDHHKNAQEVNLSLRKTTVLVFGSPMEGTLLKQKNPLVAFELPLRILVWEAEGGTTCLAMPNMVSLAQQYRLSNLPAVGKMQNLLNELIAVVE